LVSSPSQSREIISLPMYPFRTNPMFGLDDRGC